MTDETTDALITELYRSAAAKDDKWQQLLADDVSFCIGVKKLFTGKESFVKAYTNFLQSVESLEVRRVFTDGDAVCAIVGYTYVSPKGAHMQQDDAEVWSVVDGKIANFTLYYDQAEYRNFMQQ